MKPDGEQQLLRAKGSLMEAGLREDENLQPGLWHDPAHEVGALVTPAGIVVGWIDVVWEVHTPQSKLIDAEHLAPMEVEERLSSVLGAASAAREKVLIPCRYCGERFTPGHIDVENDDEKGVCHGCAERHEGAIH